jgi:hypothetical protein
MPDHNQIEKTAMQIYKPSETVLHDMQRKGQVAEASAQLDSKENCTAIQLGTQLCSAYKREPI